jgi:SAM-dependent methyltransferase
MKYSNKLEQILPPLITKGLKRLRHAVAASFAPEPIPSANVNEQDLALYWNPKVAAILETWGEGTVWEEIKYLLVNCEGNVIDIACGTGKNIEMNSFIKEIEIYGFDISDALIKKGRVRGILEYRLKVCDATHTDYEDNQFNYGYSIGSLEHFTEDGINKFLSETNRIVSKRSFHMIPVSRSGLNEGWIKTMQSAHNNSVKWWLEKFEKHFSNIYILESRWPGDVISEGKWFICDKKG